MSTYASILAGTLNFFEYMVKVEPQINGKKIHYSINDNGQLGNHSENKSWICISHCIVGYIIKKSKF